MYKKIVVAIVVVIGLIAIFMRSEENSSKKHQVVTTSKENIRSAKIKKSVVSALSRLKISMRDTAPEKSEEVFNEKTELTPMNFDEARNLTGEALQERVKELDTKLSVAIQKYPDLPPPPEWYEKEMVYLSDKYFKTVGKSRYTTEMTAKQKERQQDYINYLRDLEDSGEVVSDKKLAKVKRQMLGE